MSTSEAGAPSDPSPAPPPATAPRRKGRRILLVVLAVLAALVVVGGGTAVVVYDQITAIDRSTPEVVVEQFLDSALILKDPARVSLFVCRSWSADQAMAQINAPTNPEIRASWGDPHATITGSTATVELVVRFFRTSASGGSDRLLQNWRIELKDEDGWRVCSLTKAASLNP